MNNEKEIDYKELVRPYTRQWKWFVLSAIIFLALALLYIRYATPNYGIQAKIQILKDQGTGSELGAFRDLELMSGAISLQVEDEIEILNSRSNFIDVVKELGLNKRIMAQGRIHDTELYADPPIVINFLSPDSVISYAQGSFSIRILSGTSFMLTEEDEEIGRDFSFGTTISTEIGDIVVTPASQGIENLIDREYMVIVSPIANVAIGYQQTMLISLAGGDLSNIIVIELEDPVPQKGLDIVNSLIGRYNQKAIDERKVIADRTTDFINDRIAELYSELTSVDETAQEYKTTRGITDVTSQSNINLNLSATSRQELRDAETQRYLASQMKAIIDQAGYEELPVNIGLSEGSINEAVSSYNELVRRRDALLTSSNERNPIIVSLDRELGSLKRSLQASLEGMISNLTQRVNSLSGQLSRINSQIYSAPGQERAIRDIERERETKDGVYQYLLQKRAELQITFQSAPPKSKIIDNAHLVSPEPVSPKKPVVILAALILGMLMPFSIIYLGELLDNKIHNKLELEKQVGKIPVLAELPKLGSKEKALVKTGDRSVLAESLRILRANLDYLLKIRNKTEGGHVIFVTSSVPGEGKTFVASNLAMIYAKANKKVLLVGGDIRNPKINQFYSGKNVDKLKRVSGNKDNKGLTDYLISDTLTARDVTNTLLVSDQTVDIVHSGKLMPNPSELLMNDRLEEFVSEVRDQYDYVIVDTAPMVVVSDTMLMSKFGDLVLYVTRADFTDVKVLDFPLKMKEEGKIKHLSFIVNGVKDTNLGYGGRYGYGYGTSTKKKWWKFSA